MNQAVLLNSVYSFDRPPCPPFQLKNTHKSMAKQLLIYVKMIQGGISNKVRRVGISQAEPDQTAGGHWQQASTWVYFGGQATEAALAGLSLLLHCQRGGPLPHWPLGFAAFVSPNRFSDQLKSCRVLKGNSAFSNKQRQRTNGRESFNKSQASFPPAVTLNLRG